MKTRTIVCIAMAVSCVATSAKAVDARVLAAYTQRAADMHGGSRNLEAKVNQAISSSNRVHLNTHRNVNYVKWVKVGWHRTAWLRDQRRGGDILNDLYRNVGGANSAAKKARASLVTLVADSTDVGGIAHQPGRHSLIDAQWPYWTFFAHEIGHNYYATHGNGLGSWSCNGKPYRTVMLLNYVRGTTIPYYSTPKVYTNCRYIGDSKHNNAQRMKDIRWTRARSTF